jgi:hypothetical protein
LPDATCMARRTRAKIDKGVFYHRASGNLCSLVRSCQTRVGKTSGVEVRTGCRASGNCAATPAEIHRLRRPEVTRNVGNRLPDWDGISIRVKAPGGTGSIHLP